MTQPKTCKYISIQNEDGYWYTVDNKHIDGHPSLTISYWEERGGIEMRMNGISMDLSLIPNLVEAIQEMKPQQEEDN
jgi:hypothetical protein